MRLLDGSKRYFNGIVRRFGQGRHDENFLHFQAEVVPKFWMLTKKVRSRISTHRRAGYSQTGAHRIRRMEQEEVQGIQIEGKSDCGQFTAGHKFTLERHFDADAPHLLTRVEHEASDESYRSDRPADSAYRYGNRFTCIPEALRYRPQRVTRVPVIAGMQTAAVVGPAGEEIFVDKYSRVKVRFHWDREGLMDANSSCWIRVGTLWAGKNWGVIHIRSRGDRRFS